MTGNLSDGITAISKVLNLKGKVVPFSEDNVTLIGKMSDGSIVEGEHYITESPKQIDSVFYKDKVKVCDEVIESIRNSDLIILSMGSLFTSIIPNLLSLDVIKELDDSKAKIMYVCNLVTQPGETDDFKVSDHVNILNSYLGNHKIDIVVANTGVIDKDIAEKYATLEQKDPVIFDEDNIECQTILNSYATIDDGVIRHNVEKLSLDIYSYLIN